MTRVVVHPRQGLYADTPLFHSTVHKVCLYPTQFTGFNRDHQHTQNDPSLEITNVHFSYFTLCIDAKVTQIFFFSFY